MTTDSKAVCGGGETVTLAECPVGLFVSESGTLGLKTEYHGVSGATDCYIVETGEFFWGSGNGTPGGQAAQKVRPIPYAVAAALASTAGAGAGDPVDEACKPWRFGTGAPPSDDSPLIGPYSAGIGYAIDMLAKITNAGEYVGADGSETFEGDVRGTIMNVLRAAKLYDDEDGRFATLSAAGAGAGDWVTVPRKITMPMGMKFYEHRARDEDAQFCWEAMIEAAPAVPASPRSGAGEGEGLTETPLAIVHRWANWIAGATDSGEIPEGTPEQRQMLFADLRKVVSALSQGGGAGRSEKGEESRDANAVAWAVTRWRAEVENRPLQNVHRRGLDTTWRQVIRHFGGVPEDLIGPSHDALIAAAPAQSPSTSDAEG